MQSHCDVIWLFTIVNNLVIDDSGTLFLSMLGHNKRGNDNDIRFITIYPIQRFRIHMVSKHVGGFILCLPQR